ncbi:helix-turn-helix transcriptional regulator [uncultured Winogradskyella sp.]|uniref:helix-turn-helix transcriptional regulator n=1 Tax=uncultured Winogradskyella sp. TaxID=395353 RepID=UPI002602AFD8|nr:helix-turn-helix transcriptional regulator [uncultured Winogradskyella sp.]
MNALVAKKIKGLRKQKSLSQEQVADYLNISQSTYARIENGESNSWVSYIDSISKLFDLQPEELLMQDNVTISHNKGKSTNAYIINQLSEKLIAQYEENLKLKEGIIVDLKKRLSKYE